MPIRVKRAYEPASPDGHRVLVDRLWPRGVTRERGALGEWAKELAPSPELRSRFGHDPERFEGFRRPSRSSARIGPRSRSFAATPARAL